MKKKAKKDQKVDNKRHERMVELGVKPGTSITQGGELSGDRRQARARCVSQRRS